MVRKKDSFENVPEEVDYMIVLNQKDFMLYHLPGFLRYMQLPSPGKWKLFFVGV